MRCKNCAYQNFNYRFDECSKCGHLRAINGVDFRGDKLVRNTDRVPSAPEKKVVEKKPDRADENRNKSNVSEADFDDCMTAGEAMDALNVSRGKFNHLVARKMIRKHARLKYVKSDVMALVEEQRLLPPSGERDRSARISTQRTPQGIKNYHHIATY